MTGAVSVAGPPFASAPATVGGGSSVSRPPLVRPTVLPAYAATGRVARTNATYATIVTSSDGIVPPTSGAYPDSHQ